MTRNVMKINFKFNTGDVAVHKLNRFKMLILERMYQDGYSGEGEIQYLCRQGNEDELEVEPTYYREFELLTESESEATL